MIGILASLSWASPQWLAVSAGLGLLAAGALAWGYGRRRAWRGVGAAAALTKALAIGLLALALMEPVWASKRPKAGENLIAVVVDNSQGMRMRDTDGDSPRSRKLRDAVVGEEAGWLEQLAETFKVRRYLFDENLSHTLRFEKLDFSGRSSSLDATLRTLQQRYRNRPLAGIVLLTDGIATDTVSDQTLKNSVPIHAVPVGSDHPPVDVAIGRADLSQTPFEDAPVTCRVRLETSGCAGHKVAVELRSSDGLIVQSRTHLLQADDPSPSFRFRFRPPRPGVLFYEVSVRLLGEEAPAEATGANNRRTVVVDRGGGPYRVLYVTGRPNWEFKFLRRALSEDEQVNLVGLVRIAKKEPKFSWQGRRGETANPLFRGFDKDKKDERTEQYDQPVLIRLGTEDKKELAEGFPKTAEALFAYHGLIIDDLESGFFSRDQMELIQQFVADRAGGLLMLGGQESFRSGGYGSTPIGDVLPVYLDRVGELAADRPRRMTLSRSGWLESWTRLRDQADLERLRLEQMPGFRVLNAIRSIKPGAHTLLEATGPAGTHPALVTQRYGAGRSGALLIGDIWRWGLQNSQHRKDRGKFWRQMTRWLVSDVPGRLSLQIEPHESGMPGAMKLTAVVRGAAFEPMDNVSVAMQVTGPDRKTVQLDGRPVESQSGRYEAVFSGSLSGGYHLEATATDPKTGQPVGRAQTGWAVNLEAVEHRSVRTDRPLLERIAQATGGSVVEIDRLNRLPEQLAERSVPVEEPSLRPLWHLPPVFALVLGLLVAEWSLRRWSGLP